MRGFFFIYCRELTFPLSSLRLAKEGQMKSYNTEMWKHFLWKRFQINFLNLVNDGGTVGMKEAQRTCPLVLKLLRVHNEMKLLYFIVLFQSLIFSQTYKFGEPSIDGIGKFYFQREISKVMGHQGINWLERSSRESEEHPSKVVNNLDLGLTDVVADFGSGSGYFTRKIAPLCSLVYAVDIQEEMHAINKSLLSKNNIDNVELIIGGHKKTNLPLGKIDMLLMVDVYHELEFPYEIMTDIYSKLKTRGRLVLVEYRKEDEELMIKPLHKMSEQQITLEIESVGFSLEKNLGILPTQHMLFFKK